MTHRECEQTLTIGERTIKGWLEPDEDCHNPLEADGDGEMVLFERGRYEHNQALIDQYKNNPHAYPVERYEHGLVHYSLRNRGDYPDRKWDVCFAGYFVLDPNLIEDHEAYKKEPWDKDEPDTRLKKQITSCLQQYTDWCNGNCWGWVIEVDGEDRDSCWGYIGMDYAEERLKEELAVIAKEIEQEEKQRQQWEVFNVTG